MSLEEIIILIHNGKVWKRDFFARTGSCRRVEASDREGRLLQVAGRMQHKA